MMEAMMILERMLNDNTGAFNIEVKVNKTSGGRLPNRKMFTRQVIRQTKLSEFMDLGGEATKQHPLLVIYTVHPSQLRVKEVNNLIDELLKDLEIFLHESR
tara:strand:+ start:5681 stop:5983 length:303 start_codon:yes stop_codon:yes gene_type:complete